MKDKYPEEVKGSTGVEARLLVDGVDESRLVTLLGEKRSSDVKLETLGNLVLELDLTTKDIGGGPSLGDSETMFAVGPLGFDVTVNSLRLGVTGARNLESNT